MTHSVLTGSAGPERASADIPDTTSRVQFTDRGPDHRRLIPTRVAAGLTLALPYALWLYLVGQKASFGAYNVDDYLYARRAIALADQFESGVTDWLTGLAHSGPFGPVYLVPASLLATIGFDVHTLALTQVLFMLVHTASAWMLLRALAPRASAPLIACGVALSQLTPSLIGWATMIHFAVASSAFSIAALAAYARSERLTRLRPSVAFGAFLGLLSLTRSVAIVYVVALLGAVVLDLTISAFRRSHRSSRAGAIAAIASCVLIAAPWWIHSGEATLAHLRRAGLDRLGAAASGRTAGQMLDFRLDITLRETGVWPTLIAVGLVLIAALPRSLGRERVKGALPPIVFGLAALAGLSISMNAGTAFSLPATQALLMVGLAGAISLKPDWARIVVVWASGVAVTALCAIAVWGPTPSGWLRSQPGIPWRTLLNETGFGLTSTVTPHSASAAVVDVASSGAKEIIVLRDDSAVNIESIRYAIDSAGWNMRVNVWEASGSGADPEGRTYLLGASKARYQPWIDQEEARKVLTARGLEMRCVFEFSASNSIELWSLHDLPNCVRARGMIPEPEEK